MSTTPATVRRRSLRWSRSVMADDVRRSSWWAWCLLILLVLAVFGILGARTEGFKYLVVSHLQRETGLPVTVGASRIGWPYDLVLSDVAFTEPDAPPAPDGTPGLLRLAELRIGWRGRGVLAVTAHGGALTLRTGDDGSPSAMRWAGLADVEDGAAIAGWLDRLWDADVRLLAEQATVQWLGGDGRPVTRAENVRLVSQPLRVPRRSWRFFELSADRVLRADGLWLSDVAHEWLVSDATQVVRLGYRAVGQSSVAADPGE